MKLFVSSHEIELREIEELFEESRSEVCDALSCIFLVCVGLDFSQDIFFGFFQIWNPFSDIIAVQTEAHESCSVVDLIVTDNKHVSKVVLVFSALIAEFIRLRTIAESDFFRPLSCFGERYDDDPLPEGEESSNVAALLPLLEDLSSFVQRCHEVVANAISQLAGLYGSKALREVHPHASRCAALSYKRTPPGHRMGRLSPIPAPACLHCLAPRRPTRHRRAPAIAARAA